MLIIFSTSLVSASKTIVESIPWCYNVSVHTYLSSGNYTNVQFPDCYKYGLNDFFCECRDRGVFNLTMITDDRYVDPQRFYKLDIEIAQYNIDYSKGVKIVKDYGTFSKVDGEINGNGNNAIKVPVYIEINKTVYVDRLINNTVTVEGQTIYVDKIAYIENNTKIDDMKQQLNQSNNILLHTESKLKNYQFATLIVSVLLIICILIIFFYG